MKCFRITKGQIFRIYSDNNIKTDGGFDSEMKRKLPYALFALLMISLPVAAQQSQNDRKLIFCDGIAYRTTDPWYRIGQGTFLGSVAADMGTTINLPPGRVESNPLLGNNKTQQIAIGVGMSALILWEAHYFETRGHRKLAKIMLWTGSACHWSAAIYNARQR